VAAAASPAIGPESAGGAGRRGRFCGSAAALLPEDDRRTVEISLQSSPENSDRRHGSTGPARVKRREGCDREWTGANPLIVVPLEQSLAIQAWIAEGVDRASEELAESHAFDTEITVLESHCCALADFGVQGLGVGEELVAGVLRGFRGPLAGASLLAMEPEDALSWSLSSGQGHSPIETYVELAGDVLGAVVETAGEALEVDVELGTSRLEEDSIAGCLLRTHAPSDTVVVSARLEIKAAGHPVIGHLLLVMEPKVVSALLGALAVSLH